VNLKELDSRADAWVETRWPGVLNRLAIVAGALVGAAIPLAVVYAILKAKGVA